MDFTQIFQQQTLPDPLTIDKQRSVLEKFKSLIRDQRDNGSRFEVGQFLRQRQYAGTDAAKDFVFIVVEHIPTAAREGYHDQRDIIVAYLDLNNTVNIVAVPSFQFEPYSQN